MGYVSFRNDGYSYYKDEYEYNALFSTDEEHNELFEYIYTDMSCLPQLFDKYISKKMDITTFEILKNETEDDISELKEFLITLHPYYKFEYKETIVRAIGIFFNKLLVYSAYNKKNLDPEVIKEEWYMQKINGIMPYIFASEKQAYPEPFFPSYFYERYKNHVGENYPSYFETVIYTFGKPIGFQDELLTQEKLYHMLYFILDIDAYGVKKLTKEQRLWFYSNILLIDGLEPKSDATRRFFHFSRRQENIEQLNNFDPDIKISLDQFNRFDIGCYEIPPNFVKAFNSAIEQMKTIKPSVFYEDYEILSLMDLLNLEIEALIKSDTEVRRCKNCGKYFIVTNRRVAYCNRMDSSGKICSEVGAARSFQKKMDKDFALKIYNRAYKTHHARYKKGKMSKDDFSNWHEEAKMKLGKVRNGELGLSIFEEWLKI